MRAALSIEAGVRDSQAFDRMSADNVGGDNFVHICGLYAAVPDFVRIDDNRGSMFALLEASGLVGANLIAADSVLGQFLLEDLRQFASAIWVARPTMMFRRSLVLADKDVLLELRHSLHSNQGKILKHEGHAGLLVSAMSFLRLPSCPSWLKIWNLCGQDTQTQVHRPC